MSDNTAYLKHIEESVNKIPYGEVSFTIKMHNGNPSTVDHHVYESESYKSNPEAVSAILNLLKGLQDEKQSGSFSFTVIYKEGDINRVVFQGYERQNYN